MHWPCAPQSLSPTSTCQSQLGVYTVLFSHWYVTAEKSSSRGKLAICQSCSRHVAGWNRGNWCCHTACIILQMMSLLVISVESICNLAMLLWASFVRNITDIDYIESTSIYFSNLVKHGCSIQLKNKMKNCAFNIPAFTEGCCCVVVLILDTNANAYITRWFKYDRD